MKNDAVLTTSTTGKAEEAFVSRAEYDALKRENAELNQKLDFLMGQLHLAKKKMFGASSEQAAEQLLGQLSFLFNEAEAWTPREKKASEATAVAAHTRQKRSSDLDEVLPEGVTVEVVEHGIPEADWKRGPAHPRAAPCRGDDPRGCLLHLRLPEVQR